MTDFMKRENARLERRSAPPYWKANVVAIIAGVVDPVDLAVWDEENECFYFPDDWHQYDSTDLDRIYWEWLEAHPAATK